MREKRELKEELDLMANFKGILFNGRQLPDFVKVRDIEHSILPAVSQNLMTISGKAGAYDFGNEVGVREITVNVTIRMAEENTLPLYLEQLADWLYYEEPKKLILGDDVKHYFLAKFTGDSNMQESFLVAEGSLTFLCTNPFKHGSDKEVLIPASYTAGSEPIQIINKGNYKTEPKMRFDITKDVTNFTVVADDEFIDIGTPLTVDNSVTVGNHGKYAIRDLLTTTNGWTVSSAVHSGTVFGRYEVLDSHAFRQAGLDYGENLSGWHGATMQKPIDFSVQDFELLWYFKINTAKQSLGRLQISLLDEAGKEVFLIKVYDGSAVNNTILFNTILFGSKTTIMSQKNFPSNLTALNGYVMFKRVGKAMTVEVRDVTGKLLHQQKFTDSQGIYQGKIKQVKLHTGAYNSYPVTAMEQRDVVITNLDKASLNVGTVPLIAVAGDVLEIDNSTGAILKNGQPFYQYLNPSSSFIKLEKGANGISISPADCFTNGVINYTEKSL